MAGSLPRVELRRPAPAERRPPGSTAPRDPVSIVVSGCQRADGLVRRRPAAGGGADCSTPRAVAFILRYPGGWRRPPLPRRRRLLAHPDAQERTRDEAFRPSSARLRARVARAAVDHDLRVRAADRRPGAAP